MSRPAKRSRRKAKPAARKAGAVASKRTGQKTSKRPDVAASSRSTEEALQGLVKRMSERRASVGGTHHIRLQVEGDGGGVWVIDLGDPGAGLAIGESGREPTAEVVADGAALRAVLEGRIDGRDAFLAGTIRVRGDIVALEQLSASLGTHVPSSELDQGAARG